MKEFFGWANVRVVLGTEEENGYLNRIQLFEFKKLLSCYIHIFNTKYHDRFHSHAFSAVAVVLKGGYFEEYYVGSEVRTKWVGPGLRFIPKDYNHRIMRSEPNSVSFLIAGPWEKYWTEDFPGYARVLTWGRREVARRAK
jgi:hypothetical protein